MYGEFTATSTAFLSILWLFIAFITNVSTSNNPYGAKWGVTLINVEVINYTWIIRNFNLNELVPDDYLESPRFWGKNRDIQWQLHLYKDKPDYYRLYLFREPIKNVTAKYRAFIVDGNGKRIDPASGAITYTFSANLGYGWPEYIRKSDLNDKAKNYLPDDTLTLHFELSYGIAEGITNLSSHCRFSNTKVTKDQHLVKLLETSFLSDVQLRVNGQIINAHRAILAVHSSWFYKQFTENPNTTIIDIGVVSVSALKHALHFMYTGNIDDNIDTRMEKELLVLSNFFGIEQLKLIFEERLCEFMTPINATEILTFAELHHAKNLERVALNYIAANGEKILDRPAFEAIEKTDLNTFRTILRTLIDKKQISNVCLA